MSTESILPGPSKNAARLKLAREWHLYLGTLFAPSIIFFALTGALQLFGLHEGRPGGNYQPPVWIQKLAQIHKKQTIAEKHGPPPNFGSAQNPPPDSHETGRSPQPQEKIPQKDKGRSMVPTYLLKWFFLGTALGLVSSTLLGIYMAFKFNRSRALVWGLLFLGTAIPVALIAMMA